MVTSSDVSPAAATATHFVSLERNVHAARTTGLLGACRTNRGAVGTEVSVVATTRLTGAGLTFE
jgi:hypothetical protein